MVGFKAVEYGEAGARLFARRVYIFDANTPVAAMLPGVEIAGEGGDQGALVQGTGR